MSPTLKQVQQGGQDTQPTLPYSTPAARRDDQPRTKRLTQGPAAMPLFYLSAPPGSLYQLVTSLARYFPRSSAHVAELQ